MSNARILRNLYEAFGRGDIATVLGTFDAKIEWREAEGNPYEPSGKAWIGPDAIVKNLFSKLGAEWDGLVVKPETFHEAGAAVVVEGRYTGTFKATRKPVNAQFCHVWKVREGKIASFQQYVDTAQMQGVMGKR